MLQPQIDWYWMCENGSLYLQIDKDCRFKCHYPSKHLINLPTDRQSFSLQDTEFYLSIQNQLELAGLALTTEQLIAIMVNATAAMGFHKPIGAKSWFYNQADNIGLFHGLGLIENALNQGMVLLLEDHGVMATCILLSESFLLNEDKSLVQFDLLKLASNRLCPFIPEQSCRLSA
jgi:cell division protein ZapC